MKYQALQNTTKLAESNRTPPESLYRDASTSFRELLSPEDVMAPQNMPRILLVDDDPTFGLIMKQAAAKKSVEITFCKSLDEFSALKSWDFDVVIMDYDLGDVTGFELTSYMEQFTTEEVPVILVSQTKQRNSKHWPNAIREFVHKDLGAFAILDATFEAHEINRLHKEEKRSRKALHNQRRPRHERH